MKEMQISKSFLSSVCDLLANTQTGISGGEIVKLFNGYSLEYDIEVPYPQTVQTAPNKRSALYDSLLKFKPEQQVKILLDIMNSKYVNAIPVVELNKIKIKLLNKYGHLASNERQNPESYELIEDTRHWLSIYPEAQKVYLEALEKYKSQIYKRNILDDIRMSFEIVTKKLLNNSKSLENQIQELGIYLKSKGASPELNNMLVKLIDYYTKYQNTYVKHDDNVNEMEVDLIIEVTSSFIKHLIKLDNKQNG